MAQDKRAERELTLPRHPWEKSGREISITVPVEADAALENVRSSPVVRKLAREHGIDLKIINGTGIGGRITKRDILSFLENRDVEPPPPEQTLKPVAPGLVPPECPEAQMPPPAELPARGELVEGVPMSAMRKKIAEHMISSQRTSAHVTTVFEVDMTRVRRLRDRLKQDFLNRHGVNLTYLPFISKAVVEALKAFPLFNSSVSEDKIIYKKSINIGIAVALDWGLIVPVVKNADERSLVGLAKAIQDLATRARAKQLNPEEVQEGTFTITNPGIFGSLFGTPIINQPQVAILGIGQIAKRPVVIETEAGDSIAIRLMTYLALTFDHRVIDGAVADQFVSHIKATLENLELVGD